MSKLTYTIVKTTPETELKFLHLSLEEANKIIAFLQAKIADPIASKNTACVISISNLENIKLAFLLEK